MPGNMIAAAKPLPRRKSDFLSLRASGSIYVDKTDQIVEVLDSADFNYLERPRGFGTSLLLSTAAIFTVASEALRSLKGEGMWNVA